VAHEVLSVPFKSLNISTHQIEYYDISLDAVGGGIDLLIIDGPPAAHPDKRFARLGALQFIPVLAEDFVIIVDDAERGGEARLVNAITEEFHNRSIAVESAILKGTKRQVVFAAGKYRPACYF
jgi:hypothetical protein